MKLVSALGLKVEYVYVLNDWFKNYDNQILENIIIPKLSDEKLAAFIMKPFLRSGLKASLILTCSNFGLYLVEKFFGVQKAIEFAEALGDSKDIKSQITHIKLTERWQYTPDKNEISSLKNIENGESRSQELVVKES